VSTVLFTLMAAMLVAQVAGVYKERSLITLAREHGGTARVVIAVDGPGGTPAVLVPAAEMIVRGRVLSAVPTLSRDETRVMTRYEIAPYQFYKSTTQTSARPAPARPLIVIETGGTLEIDGLHLGTYIDIWPPEEVFKPGEDVILFLAPDEREPGMYQCVYGSSGAFRVQGGQVYGVGARRDAKPEPLEQFERRLVPR
jgi:hypothetical protein